MLAWILIGHALFGAIIGSFLNVVALRSFTGKSLQGRSGCLSCGGVLSPLMLVPVLSWVYMKGRCSHCGSAISLQYPLVEMLTAAGFAVVAGMGFPLIAHTSALLLVSFWILIVVYDTKHTIIPDWWVYFAAFFAYVLSFSLTPYAPLMPLLGALVATFPLFLLWFFSKGAAMGFGDVKLGLGIGALLGPYGGVFAVFLSFIIGAVVSLFVLMPLPRYARLYTQIIKPRLRRHAAGFTMGSEVPFGPFLVFGAFTVWIYTTYHLHLSFIEMFLLAL